MRESFVNEYDVKHALKTESNVFISPATTWNQFPKFYVKDDWPKESLKNIVRRRHLGRQ